MVRDAKSDLLDNDCVILQADINELMEKMNTYCQCMKGAAGKVAG